MRILGVLAALLALANPCFAAPKHVIVIAMENKDAAPANARTRNFIYGNVKDAPFINNTLSRQAARASNFVDELMAERSQPHYILMEAGRTTFADTSFTCDNDPLKSCDLFSRRPNWTKSREHLTAQIEDARRPALTWMTYQEGLDPKSTGACPIRSSGLYAAKHNPFVYFSDVAGEPPSSKSANCIAHTRDLSRFAEDMASNSLANYVFISPNLCHDMHGALSCPGEKVAKGDAFLRSFMPPLLTWARANKAVVFIVWDEGNASDRIPFYAAGWGVKPNYESKLRYSHRSLLKTVERMLGLPELESVSDAADLSDMFEPGVIP